MNDDLNLLARLIHAEAEGEPFIGKVAVGAVIMNRLKDPRFPNSISEIIYQPQQFSPVSDGRLFSITNVDEDSYKAARMALAGSDPTGGALFFYNPNKVSPTNWIRTREIIYLIGDHVFCL
ncbi:MAG TPA: cell wall hydrolase [Firmicutes bacterium]|nr:cell wall hydrolase [Bacillota bacterium]